MATTTQQVVTTVPAYGGAPVQQPPSSMPPNVSAQIRMMIRNLAISELVLGCVSVLIGILTIALSRLTYRSGYYSYYYFLTSGEGIWGGVWIIVAGALGLSAAKENASRCIINCHLAFSIIGSVFSWILFFIAMTYAFIASSWAIALFAVLCLVSLGAAVILIMSATYCGRLTGCCAVCQGGMSGGQPVVYTTQQQAFQGAPVQSGYPQGAGYPASPMYSNPGDGPGYQTPVSPVKTTPNY